MNPPIRRWLLPLLWTCFGACVVALAASFMLPMPAWFGGAMDGSGDGGIGLVRIDPLPATAPAAANDEPGPDWRQNPDLGQLASGDAAFVRDLPFQAWHAAQIAMPPVAVESDSTVDPDPSTTGPAVSLRQRVAAWEALAPTERSARREHWQAWQRLPAGEQAAVRDAVATFAALPEEQQQALRGQFEQLPPDERRGWLLGPRLGLVWPRLQPLFMQVPAAQREPLLAALHQCSASQLDDLAVLAQRTPPQARAKLRGELLMTSEANRSAWLHERLRH
ncbi:MAG: DUF3106 domain-containing protein [Luteimonas sp.]